MSRAPKPLPWQREVWTLVATAIREDRLGHALLLAGPPGTGKRHFARCIVAALWCREIDQDGAACGSCPDCLQVENEAHSGYFLLRLEEGKRDIPIDTVRELSEKLTLTTNDGRAKVAIIEPVDALNINGVNALLKTIEEPSPGSHLLLVTERPQALTATLRSRCQRLLLAAPVPATALAWLQDETGGKQNAEALALALDAGFGAPLKAAELLASDGLALRLAWSKALLDLAGGRGEPVPLAEAINKADPIAWLQWLYGWLSRLLRLRVAPQSGDDTALLSLAHRLPAELLDRYAAEVQDALHRIRGPADKRLLVESLLIAWVGLLARAGRAPQNAAT